MVLPRKLDERSLNMNNTTGKPNAAIFLLSVAMVMSGPIRRSRR